MNYKQEVEKVFPNAVCDFDIDYSDGIKYYFVVIDELLTTSFYNTENAAWRSAYNNLKQRELL